MIEIYRKLCQITLDNLTQYNSSAKMHFEKPQGLSYSIFSYPKSVLLDIEDTEEFIRECFFKILDRSVDEFNLKKYLQAIKSNHLSKEEFIKEIATSNERQIKQTALSE
jgi:hypothetical protein